MGNIFCSNDKIPDNGGALIDGNAQKEINQNQEQANKAVKKGPHATQQHKFGSKFERISENTTRNEVQTEAEGSSLNLEIEQIVESGNVISHPERLEAAIINEDQNREEKISSDPGIKQLSRGQNIETSLGKLEVVTKNEDQMREERTISNPEIDQSNGTTVTVEDESINKIMSQALDKIETLIHFQEKLNVLNKASAKLEQINTAGNTNKEAHKSKTLNKIKGYILFETMNYLREIKKKADHYVSYAEQFPYPISIDIYEDRKKEIVSLENEIEKFPNEDFVKDRKDIIGRQIDEALRLLKERANYNEFLKTSLRSEKINSFPNKKLEEISDVKNKVVKELERIRKYDNVLDRNMDKIETILNTVCNECEKYYNLDVKKLHIKTKGLVYRQETITDKLYLSNEVVAIIKSVFDCASKLLRDAELKAVSTAEINKKVEDNQHKKPTIISKAEHIKNFRKGIDQIEIVVKNLKEEINKISNPLKTDDFNKLANEVFQAKERLEDIPEEYPEVEPRRNVLLQDISSMLANLDEDIAQLVVNQKPTELQLQLQDSFKEITLSKNIVRDSVDFVQAIREKAQKFQKYVENYFGTSDLTDYYVIEENLTRLLEELDTINCRNNDILRTKIVKTMDYIKQLINDLEQNAEKQNP